LPPSPIYLEVDPVRLEQVLGNLLSNATKYTLPGGHIKVTVEEEAGQAVIKVQDDGIGISPEMLPQIFDLFTQSDSILGNSQGGMGIGLTLVRKLVELHGGKVEAQSAGVGQGSEFIVSLPLAPTTAQQPVPSPSDQAGSTARSLRVLVVDDSPDAAKVFGMLMETYGCQVRTAHDGPGALELAVEYRPDVVMLDIGLPGMDGYEVAKRIRGEAAIRDVVLVATTGYGQDTDRVRSREAGFDHHLVKPVGIDAMQKILEQVK
jgi:CheY-like chemotaxis protein